jgi:hypothetical protein
LLLLLSTPTCSLRLRISLWYSISHHCMPSVNFLPLLQSNKPHIIVLSVYTSNASSSYK